LDRNNSLTLLAKKSGTSKFVEMVINAGADVNKRDAKERTPRMWAAGPLRMTLLQNYWKHGGVED
jgi:ankyrin repeat protein